MNSLSWMIYLAEAFSDLDSIAGIACVISLAFIAVGSLICFVVYASTWEKEEEETAKQAWFKTLKYGVVAAIVTSVLAALIPSKDTMYLIAASELGEYLANTDVAQAGADMVKDPFGSISAHLKANLPDTIEAAKEVAKQ